MFVDFFFDLRAERIGVTLPEYLSFLGALERGCAAFDPEAFYYLARCSLVKDERIFDRFDRVFARRFGRVVGVSPVQGDVPSEWLDGLARRYLDQAERRQIAALGGWTEIMAALRRRLAEQDARHEGGSHWIGTGGTSPFGARGVNPAGVRMGPEGSGQGRAIKVWEERTFKNLDDQRELGTRNFKVALRRLRRFVREGSRDELDIGQTIDRTAKEGGLLDPVWVPERKNRVKVLLLLDVGGSMTPWIEVCERLFSAARAELQNLESYYFHNCIYESVWRDNRRRRSDRVGTAELLRRLGPDWNVIFVGDASMSPYELSEPGGSVEHWNQESGEAWLRRVADHFPRCVWLNPVASSSWRFTVSTGMVRALLRGRMEELTVAGLGRALDRLRRPIANRRPLERIP